MLKGEVKKQSILEVAEKLFFEKGYADTTIEDILSALGISKGSLYHYFDSKFAILQEWTENQARDCFARYQAERYDDALAAFNGLLYWALPFHTGAERLLSLLLPLNGTPEGGILQRARWNAQETLFLPELERVLALAKAEGTAYWRLAATPEMCWDAAWALCGRLMGCASKLRAGGDASKVVDILEAARFLWERTLDLPFGSVEIIRAEEALTVIHQAVKHVNHLPGETPPESGENKEPS